MNGFSFATPEDSAGILRIMEADITPGGLQLLYTRRDDPCGSFLAESPGTVVGVIKAEEKEVATIAAIPRKMYIGGIPRKVCYVTNMKRLKDADVFINWYEMFKEMCREVGCDFYFCSLLNDNEEVQKMLHKKRRYMPYSEVMCGYKTYIINPGSRTFLLRLKNGAGQNLKAGLCRGRNCDEAEIVSFLNDTGRDRDLFPVIKKLSDIGDIRAEDFCLLKRDGHIVAAGALWDRRKVKQYVVKGCHGIYAVLRLLNPVLPLLGYIQIPGDDKTADFAFISFLLAMDDREEYYRILLEYICKEAAGRYKMLVIGTDSANAKRSLLDSLKSVSFETQFNEIIMTNMDSRIPPEYDRGRIEAECALL